MKGILLNQLDVIKGDDDGPPDRQSSPIELTIWLPSFYPFPLPPHSPISIEEEFLVDSGAGGLIQEYSDNGGMGRQSEALHTGKTQKITLHSFNRSLTKTLHHHQTPYTLNSLSNRSSQGKYSAHVDTLNDIP